MPPIDAAELEKRFTHHPPKDDQAERFRQLRLSARVLATRIVESTPTSREQSLALTALEESVFWANAAIARNE